MKSCAIVKNGNDQFVIGEIDSDKFSSILEFENFNEDFGQKMIRCDGNVPKWADKLVEEFFQKVNIPNLYLAYVTKIENNPVLIGLLSE